MACVSRARYDGAARWIGIVGLGLVLAGCTASDAVGPRPLESASSPRVSPAYPNVLRYSEVEGGTSLRVALAPDGSPIVDSIEVLTATHELFGRAAVLAVEKWRFVSRERSVEVRFRFRIARERGCPTESWRDFRFDEVTATGEVVVCLAPVCGILMMPLATPKADTLRSRSEGPRASPVLALIPRSLTTQEPR